MTASNLPPARLLHVSDVHFGCTDEHGDQSRILEQLVKAVEDEQEKIDVVVFTGDLAQAGAFSEFQQGQEWLEALCQAVSAPCILVPGNHDLKRSVAEKKILRSASVSLEQFGMWRDEIYKSHPQFGNFFDWFRQAKSEFPTFANDWAKNPAIDVVTVPTEAGNCYFLCLNTALLSCDNEDEGKLCIDLKALNGALKGQVAERNFVVAVGHHPEAYLAPWNRAEFSKILTQATGPHAYLHGHLHDLEHSSVNQSTGAGIFRGAAGAAYPGSPYPQRRRTRTRTR